MRHHADEIVIVGGGVVGAAIFCELAIAGRSVTLIEQHEIASGTTKASGGIVRCFDLDEIRMKRAIRAWRSYAALCEMDRLEERMVRCGMLYMPRPHAFDRAREIVGRYCSQVSLEWLGEAEIRRSFGTLLCSIPKGAVWEGEAGYFDPCRLSRSLVEKARALKGTLFEREKVAALTRESGRTVGVRGKNLTVHADKVVIAAGAWTPSFLDASAIPHDLDVGEIQSDLYTGSRRRGIHPAFVDDVHGLHGRGDADTGGLYIGLPAFRCRGSSGIPESSAARTARTNRIGVMRFACVVPGSRPAHVVRSAECYSADGRGCVRLADSDPSVVLATGLSGGGFKMAPWAAEEVRRLLEQCDGKS